jgi:hypothetical protein
MGWVGPKGSDRTVRWALALGVLIIALGVSCDDDAGNVTGSGTPGSTSSDLVGTWRTVAGFDDVTLTLEEDGAFTWENRNLGALGKTSGTWTADATTITSTFAEDGRFCPRGTLTWEYQLEGDTLTSQVVATTCPGPFVPESWEFERQPGT